MKKLLSLLSVLTISGAAIPTPIAASPYQKQETIKNNDIIYQQTNNLEKLKRDKRQWDDAFQQNLWYEVNARRKTNISLLQNVNSYLGNLLYIDARSILQSFLFNNQHLNTLENRGERLISYLRVGNINMRLGRAILYTEPNNYFEGTISVFWNKSSSGDNYKDTPDHKYNSGFDPGHIEI